MFTRMAFSAALFAALLSPAFAKGDTKWGAIALDTQKAEKEPAWGVGGADTEQEASDIAMQYCKDAEGVECKVAVTYQQCGALAVDGKGNAGWGKAPTKAEVEKQALEGCGTANCSVVKSDCNTSN
ncbi:MAG: DUF4189 domain-containing protein [Alphaproteobacteria bacterium]|nr:DUF4189 domain-containing protein [Alphaproteobacteria bacterium]